MSLLDLLRSEARMHVAMRQGSAYGAWRMLVEKPLIEAALELTAGNQVQAAVLLGVNRNTLRKRLREYGICPAWDRVVERTQQEVMQ